MAVEGILNSTDVHEQINVDERLRVVHAIEIVSAGKDRDVWTHLDALLLGNMPSSQFPTMAEDPIYYPPV
jgi:hypothetical protein